ncbi:MAG TPA: polyamine aminopropyltransferase [Pyrinomonadaceae bacterium]|nr:polyamine aminopropyltransferase [Chloracidobacterium sp.]MBP9935021.1 polyamine aminopropyltransferase [Pyrinomonadaceae bacterium]MBK7801352.1 polyamine aminopropyltransferase [Chloracidobacterium sp.]MBK9436672.1 polyamine aminopropyltransferase [Chloracidobacterium sp.]MBL0241662.1 polyamine aminopropyltransferase [Chloracidobacterium sp.]
MKRAPLLFLNVFVIATCGLIYELLAGTLSSYVLGDSVTQFSLIIGIYLFAMGVGSWLSRFIDKHIAEKFIDIELAVAVIGGFSAPLLFLTFANLSYFSVVLYSVVFIIGTLVGLEIPLLMRILQDEMDFKDLISRVLAFDYIGALAASLLFPIFFVPKLGLTRTSLLFGMLNAAVGIWGTWLLLPLLKRNVTIMRVKGFVILALLAIAFIKADRLTTLAEDALFVDNIIYAKSSTYQRIVVTKGKTGYALFLNGNLQFNSFDEYRYHEALVHPAFASFTGDPRRVLVLGGGDGLAVREILKYPSVEFIQLVDLDPDMTKVSAAVPALGELNKHSLDDPRVHVTNADAFVWLDSVQAEPFDIAIVDFPDPNNFALGKLYTTRFYNLLKQKLRPDSSVVIQTTSPLIARKSFWCVVKTLEASGYTVRPYQTTVPSFGIWGFALVKLQPFEKPQSLRPGIELRFLNSDTFASLFEFPADTSMPNEELEINRLDNQSLVRYYEAEWRRFEQ